VGTQMIVHEITEDRARPQYTSNNWKHPKTSI